MWLSDTHRHINEAIGHIQIWMWPSDTHKHECGHQTYTAIIEAIRHIRIWLWPSDTQIQLWPSDTCRHRNEAIRHTQIWMWPSDKHCYTSGQAPSQTHTLYVCDCQTQIWSWPHTDGQSVQGLVSDGAPWYVSESLHKYKPSRQLRSSSDSFTLCVLSTNRNTLGERSSSFIGPTVWNSLPLTFAP